MPHRPYIVGNWKMNGTRAMLAEARAIDRAAGRHPGVQVALAPPFTLVHSVAEETQTIGTGGQDCHIAAKGAHTGDVSPAMLADAGADFVIVGHSERRRDHGEDDALVKAKAEAALASGLGVIVCVGETLAERDAGAAETVVKAQVTGSLPEIENGADVNPARVAVAYEPVWAIGTGRVAAVDDVIAMHRAIRATLLEAYGDAGAKVRILYGGSVNAENARDLLAAEGVGGALVGGASLAAESFMAIVAAAASEA
ncbi:MAG: triose-phosphate isomerase [Pseudomonadota bacterium]